MTIGEIFESFIRIPERIQSVEKGIGFVVSSLSNVQTLLSVVQKSLHREKPDPTFVYLLPPDYTLVRPPFYAHCIRLDRGQQTSISFNGYYDCPPGLWVVVAGPALVKGVRIGNMSQDGVSSDFSGHVCKTRDRWQVGVNLTVHLEGQ